MHSRSRFRVRTALAIVLGASLLLAACGGDESADVPDPVAVEDDAAADEPADEPVDDASDEPEPADEDSGEPADEPAPEPAPGAEQDEVTEPAPSPAPEPADGAGADCSAQGATAEVVPADLPDEVAEMRDFLIDAARRCDEQALYTAASESEQFSFTFGSETDPIGYWWELEEAGQEPFLRLVQVLSTTPAIADGGEMVVWPRVHTGRPEDTTDEAWAEITWMDDPKQQAENAGGYLGWRVGIATDGDWRFFIAGD